MKSEIVFPDTFGIDWSNRNINKLKFLSLTLSLTCNSPGYVFNPFLNSQHVATKSSIFQQDAFTAVPAAAGGYRPRLRFYHRKDLSSEQSLDPRSKARVLQTCHTVAHPGLKSRSRKAFRRRHGA